MKAAGYVPGKDMKIAMDVAASEFHNTETGLYELKNLVKELRLAMK